MSPDLPDLDLGGLSIAQRMALGVSVAAVLAAAGVLVVVSLRSPAVDSHPPTPAGASPAGDTLVGPLMYTVDASDPGRWRFFDFSRGSVVEDPEPGAWDLAFRRFHIIANGGDGFPGRGGIVALEGAAFDSVRVLPGQGYLRTEADGDSTHAATEDWYRYSFTSHVLSPRPVVYGVRTADGRYAKLEIVSYYCPEARPGCVTVRYVYQGDGSRRVASDGPSE